MSKKILVVDDEKELREIVADFLTFEDFEVLQASNGEEGLQAVLEKNPDLVISDIQMPKMTGVEMLDRIQEMEGKKPPVILVTGYSPVSAGEAFEKGALGYFSKPFNFEAILQRVNDLINNRTQLPNTIEPHPDLKEAHIYVAEDDLGDQNLLNLALKESGWESKINFHFFQNGNELLDAVSSKREPKPDLFLVDLNMPKVNGFEVLEKIKEGKNKTPVVVLTSSHAEGDMKKAYDLHADSFITKPWTPEAWKHLILSVTQSWIADWRKNKTN